MVRTLLVLSAVTLLLQAAPVAAQSLRNAQRAFQSGNWAVLRSVDTMTDEVLCTGIYKDNYGVQLSDDTLFIGIRGGIESITLRFGENQPREMRLANKLEEDLDSVILEGSEFAEALRSNRLRAQVLTRIRGVVTLDLETTGIQAALASIKSGCPVQSEGPITNEPIEPPEGLCSDQLVSRMKAAGISDAQIAKACRN